MERSCVKILGVNVDKVNMQQALDVFSRLIESEGCSVICTPNPEMIYKAREEREFRDLLNRADLAIPDGIAVVKASKILGDPLEERVTGIDFARNALEIAAERGKSVFLLGAKPGIAELAASNLIKEIPSLRVAGLCDGYFQGFSEDAVADLINSSGADFLLVALGSPKQEYFIDKYRDRLAVKVCIGIGGSFDVWSGSVKRAPAWMQKCGLEWFYRLVSQPSRLGRVIRISRFLSLVRSWSGSSNN